MQEKQKIKSGAESRSGCWTLMVWIDGCAHFSNEMDKILTSCAWLIHGLFTEGGKRAQSAGMFDGHGIDGSKILRNENWVYFFQKIGLRKHKCHAMIAGWVFWSHRGPMIYRQHSGHSYTASAPKERRRGTHRRQRRPSGYDLKKQSCVALQCIPLSDPF